MRGGRRMYNRARQATLKFGISLGALLTAGSVAAQTAGPLVTASTQTVEPAQAAPAQPPPASSQAPAQVAEVIVTATKRAENIQDVPVAVQAIGGAQIREVNITSLGDLTKIAPSLNFAENYTPRNEATFIRGVGTYTTSDAIEPSVGIVVDGVALGRQGMAYLDPFDISQVEVLRGPQGTLFGKNASAGVISINTQAPSLAPDLSARALFGNRDEQQYGMTIAGAIAPDVATRITAYYNTRDGDIRDTLYNRDINGSNNYGLRAKIKYAPGPISVELIADYNRSAATCCAWIFSSDGGPGTFHNLLTNYGITANDQNYSNAANLLPESRSTSGGVSINAHALLGGEDITSITAFRGWQTYEVADLDQLPISVGESYNQSRQYQFSEELRASNSGTSALAHTIGLYYFHYLIRGDASVDFPASGGLFGPLGDVQASQLEQLVYNNGAVFGELTYSFPDAKTKLRVGARVTIENLAATTSRADNIEFVPGFEPYQVRDNQTDVGESFVVALQHNFTPRVMSYAQISRGFKGAAYDLPSATDPSINELVSHRVAPEIAMNYELGVRSQLFDRTLTLNATLFYETFDNYQATSFDAAVNAFRLANIGSLHSAGPEVEFTWRPTRSFTFGGGVTYLDARYDNYKNGTCQITFYSEGLCTEAAPGVYTIDLTGRRLYYAPEWTFTLNSRYDIRNLPGPFDGYVSANYAYRSATAAEPSLDPATYLPAYGLLDARLGVTSKDKRYEVALYAKNLTDQSYLQTHFFATLFGGLAAGNSATAAFQGLRRSYGVELIGKF